MLSQFSSAGWNCSLTDWPHFAPALQLYYLPHPGHSSRLLYSWLHVFLFSSPFTNMTVQFRFFSKIIRPAPRLGLWLSDLARLSDVHFHRFSKGQNKLMPNVRASHECDPERLIYTSLPRIQMGGMGKLKLTSKAFELSENAMQKSSLLQLPATCLSHPPTHTHTPFPPGVRDDGAFSNLSKKL